MVNSCINNINKENGRSVMLKVVEGELLLCVKSCDSFGTITKGQYYEVVKSDVFGNYQDTNCVCVCTDGMERYNHEIKGFWFTDEHFETI